MRDKAIRATTLVLDHPVKFLGLKMLLVTQAVGILATALWIIIH